MSDFHDHGFDGQDGISFREAFGPFLKKIRQYYILFIGLVVFFAVLSIPVAWVVEPSYTATATIGPPMSSLMNDTMLGQGLSGSLGGIASRLTGASGQGDPFSTYTQLLTSNRLAQALAQKKGFLEEVFYERYDEAAHAWIPKSGPIAFLVDLVRSAFHYPTKIKPDQDDLSRFLESNLDVSSSLTSNFVTVSFSFHDPAEAQNLLATILATADNIVREDQRADVRSRLAYLTRTLPTVTQADQRDSLISILSSQQQKMMIIAADKHFATDFVDPSHADPRPTFPSPKQFLLIALFLGFAVWLALVHLLQPDHWLLVRAEHALAWNRGVLGGRRFAFLRWTRRSGAEN